jgi:hypothetical protein
MAAQPYRQYLEVLDLSLEHNTQNTPDATGWFLRQGDQVERFRSQAAAQQAWKGVVEASGWSPPKKQVDASEVLRRASAERWARNRAG